MAGVTEQAPAKVNLDLYVEGRRGDGYHLLDSVVAFTDFGDTLEVTPAAADSLAIEGPFADALAQAGESLVQAALDGIRGLVDGAPGFAVTLTKRIPLAAGLGGGSADAGAALRAGARILGLAPDDARLHRLAGGLGADVPACLRARPARLRGIGDVLDPAPQIPPLALVLVNPREPAPTGSVYRRLDAAHFRHAPTRNGAASVLPDWFAKGKNDLEEAARGVAPVIGVVIDALHSTGAPVVRLCGSGATVFAAFADAAAAARAAAAVRTAQPAWWVQETRLA